MLNHYRTRPRPHAEALAHRHGSPQTLGPLSGSAFSGGCACRSVCVRLMYAVSVCPCVRLLKSMQQLCLHTWLSARGYCVRVVWNPRCIKCSDAHVHWAVWLQTDVPKLVCICRCLSVSTPMCLSVGRCREPQPPRTRTCVAAWRVALPFAPLLQLCVYRKTVTLILTLSSLFIILFLL